MKQFDWSLANSCIHVVTWLSICMKIVKHFTIKRYSLHNIMSHTVTTLN